MPTLTGAANRSVRDVRRFLVEISRRHSRVAHEAEDLAHDLIVAALRRALPLDDTFVRTAPGAARRHAAFVARTAGRRRVRELRAVPEDVDPPTLATGGAPVSALSPALQTTLFLLVAGLDKAELRAVLGVNDAALRKRLQALRAHAPLARPTLPVSTDLAHLRRSQVRLLPRFAARLARNQQVRRVLAAGDPDGHGLIFAELLTPKPGTATTSARVPDPAHRTKGSSCFTASSRTSRSSSS